MELPPETDHFKLLEDKVGKLIEKIQSFNNEKESYLKTIDEQKSQIAELTNELGGLREIKNKAKDRIALILEKIDELAI